MKVDIASQKIINKLFKLDDLRNRLKKGEKHLFTRFTVLKNINKNRKELFDYSVYLANLTNAKVSKFKRPAYIKDWDKHKKLIKTMVKKIKLYSKKSTKRNRMDLEGNRYKLEYVQGWRKNPWWSGNIRVIKDPYVLIIEDAMNCMLYGENDPWHIYRLSKDYVDAFSKRKHSNWGDELSKPSYETVNEIVDFWIKVNKNLKA